MFIRCIQLIEPALSKIQTQYIERLLAIYLDEESSKLNQSLDDGKIHTLEDYTPRTVPSLVETSDVEGSIWKQTPGKIKFHQYFELMQSFISLLNYDFFFICDPSILSSQKVEILGETIGFRI